MEIVKRYRHKPTEIEALRWTGTNVSDVCKFIHKDVYHCIMSGHLYLNGVLHVNFGDYVIKGTNGEFYPCDKILFKQIYQEIEGA